MKRILLVLSLMLCSYSAFAWNCTNPLAERVLVPSTTTGTYGDGDGQLALFNGQLYECEVVPPSKPSTPVAHPVTNSNSNSNTNNNTLSQTQGQKQGQSQSNSSSNNNASSATNAGNDSSYSNNETTTIKPESASAITPTLIPTAPCLGSIGGAAQSVPGGISFGVSKVDKGCDSRQAALLFAVSLHNPEAAARIMCVTRAAKAAKLTLAQCLAIVAPTPIFVAPPTPPTPIAVTVNVPTVPTVEPRVVYIVPPQPPVTVTPPLGSFKPAKHPTKKPMTKGKPCVVPKSLTEPSS
jgi:hypothetical protein